MSVDRHWATAFVGREWDPADRHCWAFCREVWAHRFGWEVPGMALNAHDARMVRRAFATSPEYANWQPVETPREGDAVVMARGARPCHVGIWVDPASVLHSVAGGALCTPAGRLGDLGYRIVGFWRREAV